MVALPMEPALPWAELPTTRLLDRPDGLFMYTNEAQCFEELCFSTFMEFRHQRVLEVYEISAKDNTNISLVVVT